VLHVHFFDSNKEQMTQTKIMGTINGSL